jgi:hypothetical protein
MSDHVDFRSTADPAGSEAGPAHQPDHRDLLGHLQTALEIEYSTVPIYLFTYYSIARLPDASAFPKGTSPARIEAIQTFANQAGGLTMSVAVEEMLHMALVGNLIRALGGTPDLNLYRKPSTRYPTPLPFHNPRFNPDPEVKGELKIPLARFSETQIQYFLAIEYPEKKHARPQGHDWDTIGQFYDYIRHRIEKHTKDADFQHVAHQLAPGRGYYSSNNTDTNYPDRAGWDQQPIDWRDPSARGAAAARYPNAGDSGGLVTVHDRASALRAIDVICEQGEGNPADPTHEDDDPRGKEETHWYKWKTLDVQLEALDLSAEEVAAFVHPFPDNPTRAGYAVALQYDYRPFVDLANAVFTYIFQMTQISYRLSGAAQQTMFHIGMHKAMIFVLDKIINAMRYYYLDGDGTSGNTAGGAPALAPTFEHYPFASLETAKAEMVALFGHAPLDFQQQSPDILRRLRDLPDVHVGPDGVVRF